MARRRNRLFLLILAHCLATSCAGCSRSTGYERYIPTSATAWRAVETALTAWQEGQDAGGIRCGSAEVQVVDSHRRPGQRLEGYEVLGEVIGRDGPRCFAVRLQLDNPREEQKARFCVIGIDPLWVFREEEYEMITHWECFPTQTKGERSVSTP